MAHFCLDAMHGYVAHSSMYLQMARLLLYLCLRGPLTSNAMVKALMDSLLQTSAACCGLYAYRPTRGSISRAGLTLVAGVLDSVAWVCRTPSLLPRLGDAFCLPGMVQCLLCLGAIQSCSCLSVHLSASLHLSLCPSMFLFELSTQRTLASSCVWSQCFHLFFTIIVSHSL